MQGSRFMWLLVTGMTSEGSMEGLSKFILLWNQILGCCGDQMGVRQITVWEQDLLAKFQRHAHGKRAETHERNEQIRNRQRGEYLYQFTLWIEKVRFKVMISGHGKWSSNDCDNRQIGGVILQGKCWSLRSLISPEWNHIKCLMIAFIYSNEAFGAFLMERCDHQSGSHSLSVGNILFGLAN